jgi:hypothetical protein
VKALSFSILLIFLSGCASTNISSYEEGCQDGLNQILPQQTDFYNKMKADVCDDLVQQRRNKRGKDNRR